MSGQNKDSSMFYKRFKFYFKSSGIYPLLKRIRFFFEVQREYGGDKRMFMKNYVDSSPSTIDKVSYEMIRTIHSVEKGFSNDNPRPFGILPTNTLMKLVKEYERLSAEQSGEKNFSYQMTIGCLTSYVKFYEDRGWTQESQYQVVKSFLEERASEASVPAGVIPYSLDKLNEGMQFDYLSFVKGRRSVRKFSGEKVPEEVMRECIDIAKYAPSACNRQMVKVYDVRSEKASDYIVRFAQGKSAFVLDTVSFLLITFDMNAFYFSGERNQGWFNAGLFAMNLINAMHSKGIGSCFIQFGNTNSEEKKIKADLGIPGSERIAIILAYGYYTDETKVPDSTRKETDSIYRIIQ